jgi:ribose transport system substrate-binding protein
MRAIASSALMGLLGASFLTPLAADEYKGAPRTFLFNPAADVCFKDTAKYKKAGPYTIGFSNAGLGDSWRVVMLDGLKKAASEHKDQIKHLLITDAGHDDAKQIADIQDLISRGVDLLIVSANTEKALDPAVSRAMKQGIPVVMVDRRVSSDNFVTFVTASDQMMGRLYAQWLAEKLHGKGNIVILGGQAGSSPNEARVRAAMQVLDQYPDIKILDTVYSDWSPVKGKQVIQAVVAKYGKQADAVLSAHPRFDRSFRGSWLQGRRDTAAYERRCERRAADSAQIPSPRSRGRLPTRDGRPICRDGAKGVSRRQGSLHHSNQCTDRFDARR